MQQEVQKVMFSDYTPEGHTKKHFIDTFESEHKTVVDVRQFIDGMHEYLIERRGKGLSDILVDDGWSLVDSQGHEENGEAWKNRLTQEQFGLLSSIIFGAVEEAVYLPLAGPINSLLPSFMWRQVVLYTSYQRVCCVFFIFYV